MCFLIGSCWLFFSFANDLKTSLHPLNINSELKDVHKKLLIDNLHGVVLFFSDVKELSRKIYNQNDDFIHKVERRKNFDSFLCRLINEFNAIYEFMILDLFLWSLLSISCTLMVFVAQLVEF